MQIKSLNHAIWCRLDLLGPMFIVSTLVPGRPVTTVQVTPRSRNPTAGLDSLGLSIGPLRHLKIVSRPELDHSMLLSILAEHATSLETLSFELCGEMNNLNVSVAFFLFNSYDNWID